MGCACNGSGDTTKWNVYNANGTVFALNVTGKFKAQVQAAKLPKMDGKSAFVKPAQ